MVRLREHFDQLLESQDGPAYSRRLNPVDAVFAFRLFLGRNPDATHELPGLLDSEQTLREFLSDLLNSSEFSRQPGFFPPNRLLMAELDAFRLWFNSSDREMGARMALGQYESRPVQSLTRALRPGMRCVDAGAHIGFYTCLMAAAVGEAGAVYAFEPVPASYDLLVRNIRENRFEGRAFAYRAACSDTAGPLSMSLVSTMCVAGDVGGAERTTVAAVRVDEVVQGPIDVIKLDVEGHEPAAIRGMARIIERDRPTIFSEVNEYWLRTCSASSGREYVQFLESLGYEVYDMTNGQRLASGGLQLDILETMDVMALPSFRSSTASPSAATVTTGPQLYR